MQIFFFVILLSLSTLSVAEVYKRTLPNGSVEFTDIAPDENAKPLKLAPLSTYPGQAPSPVSTAAPDSGKATIDEPAYQSISITSPANDVTIRENGGSLTVNTSIKPALAAGHLLVLYLDGQKMQENTSGNFQLSNVDRGTHSLQVHIMDHKGKTLLSSQSITIHLQRTSIISK